MKNVMPKPWRLYLLWIAICFFFYLFIPALSANSDSSAQVPFMLWTYALVALVCGTFLISLINMFLFRKWFRKFWYVNVTVTLSLGGLIIWFLIKMITL